MKTPKTAISATILLHSPGCVKLMLHFDFGYGVVKHKLTIFSNYRGHGFANALAKAKAWGVSNPLMLGF